MLRTPETLADIEEYATELTDEPRRSGGQTSLTHRQAFALLATQYGFSTREQATYLGLDDSTVINHARAGRRAVAKAEATVDQFQLPSSVSEIPTDAALFMLSALDHAGFETQAAIRDGGWPVHEGDLGRHLARVLGMTETEQGYRLAHGATLDVFDVMGGHSKLIVLRTDFASDPSKIHTAFIGSDSCLTFLRRLIETSADPVRTPMTLESARTNRFDGDGNAGALDRWVLTDINEAWYTSEQLVPTDILADDAFDTAADPHITADADEEVMSHDAWRIHPTVDRVSTDD
jgi:DNA-binding CsgD family transcriptional regulator